MRVEREVPVGKIVYRHPLPWRQETTARYGREMMAGAAFPAVKCALRPDGLLQLKDGRHRLAATMALGRTSILARFSTEPLRTP